MKVKILSAFLFFAITLSANATTTETIDPNARATELIQRVHDIRKMDRKEISPEQRMELKDELKDIKKELRELDKAEGLDDKVSISIGAIIIIILLLIIL